MLSLAEVLLLYLMFSQAVFISSLSCKFSKVANLFEILIFIKLYINNKNGFFTDFAVNYSMY